MSLTGMDIGQAPLASAYLFSDDFYAGLRKILADFHVEDQRFSELGDLVDAVADNKVSLDDVPSLLQEAFGLSPDQAKKMACDFLGVAFLPFEHFVPDVVLTLRSWGGDPKNYPSFRVARESVKVEDLVRGILQKSQLDFSDFLQKRLAFLVKGYVQGERDISSLATFFGRSLNIGGLGLSKEDNDTLLKVVEEECRGVELVDDLDKGSGDQPAVEGNVISEVDEEDEDTALLPEIRPSSEVMVQEVGEEKRGVRSVPEATIAPAAQDRGLAREVEREHTEAIRTAFDEALELALERARPALEVLQLDPERFIDVAAKHLRGLRDPYQTRDYLEHEAGVRGQALTELLEAIRAAEDAYRVAVDALIRTEDEAFVLDDVDAVTEERQVAKKSDRLVGPPPEKAGVYLSRGSVPPRGAVVGQKIPVVDVVVPPTATRGPLEQLQYMAIGDFRRLSSDPQQATEKIAALIESLSKVSDEEYVAGVRAWRQSAVVRLYLTLAAEALQSGLTLAEVSSQHRSSGQESLTPAEILALQGLNDKLRF
jgi:hypothetical protein